MQVIKEEVLPLFTKPYDPRKAEVGKLYELSLIPWDISDVEAPKYYIYDTRGNVTNKTWEPKIISYCLVLSQEANFTVVLVGEDIIHVADDDLKWQVQLIPLKQPSNQHDS